MHSYGGRRTQVVLVYLEWFGHNSLLKCISQPNIVGVQGRSRSSMLVHTESSSAASLCLSATILMLMTVAEITLFMGVPKSDALVRRTP